ncbi:hypothetical protein K0H81_13365 [Shewanella halotolerans]|nr:MULTISPECIES: FlgO family outer membrane protein [Shewanella]QYJ83690.1 hypothetical protein K0H80_06655 [Shewanella aegiceratis]QYJ88770.1 hypothetical protein K0H81_13365 [Shewanella halotolerans]
MMRNALIISSLLLLGACAANEPATPTLQTGNSLPASSSVMHLTQQLANELVRQNDQLTPKQPLLVATPVLLDNLKSTNALGLQIQQGLIAAMHDHQFNLVDLNVGENVRVTDQGELLLTRDWRQLPADLPVEHVLVSTMSLKPDGVVVNSRIVNVTNNRVVSVAAASVSQAELADYLSLSEKVVAQDGKLIRYSSQGQGDVQIKGVKQ